MHCQNFSCLYAISCLSLAAFSSGYCSNIDESFLINFKNFLLITKKPPLIQLVVIGFFSVKFNTSSLFNFSSPNLAGGLTAVIVTSFFS